tara:strand:+ start:209 stop:652 length:444 start_codon:yes stop_codon:yes gene_type:complete
VTQRFLKLDKEVFDIFWPDLSILFNKVISEQGAGRDNLELLYTKIKNDLLEVWIYKGEERIQATYCTAITEYPKKKSLFWGYMSAVDNNMNEWKEPMLLALKNYALYNECDCLEFFSTRTGWNKIFEDAGATVENIGTIYEVTLNGK